MSRPIFVVDAFADGPFRGNPAAVVPLEPGDAPDAAWMQQVAAEMKHSETAFVQPRPDGGFDLRWFTPEVEVDLCGHATLASAHVLFETGRLRHDATGRVPHPRRRAPRATREPDGAVQLDFPTAPPEPCDAPAGLLEALGIDEGRVAAHRPASSSCSWSPTPRPSASSRPTSRALRALTDVRGVYVTAPGDDGEHDIVSRCFAPRVGIDEDPVTGSMHCVLGAYWCERLGKTELHAHQASARGGDDARQARGRPHAARRARAITVLRGELAGLTPRAYARARCQATCAAMPSRSDTCGSQPSSSRARSIAPPLRNESPACFGPRSTATGAPATSPTSAISSLSVISAPPARFT